MPRPGVCFTCRTWTDQAGECWNCQENRRVLGFDPLPINVVTLYRKPSPVRDWLTRYKGRDTQEDPLEPSYAPLVEAMLGRFIIEHGGLLEERVGGIDSVQVVPSSMSQRPPPHPLDAVVDALCLDRPRVQLLAAGTEKLDWLKPSPDGYRIIGKPQPQRVLLIDDVHTTGSRSNSAAYTLRQGGHEVAGILVIGRRVNPDYKPAIKEFWDEQASLSYNWSSSPGLVAVRFSS
jgi:hypothetical protein